MFKVEEIKSKTNIKWISDCRDPWSDFFQFRIMPMSNYIFKKHIKWEKICLKSADSVIVTSPSLKNTYSKVNSNTYLINKWLVKSFYWLKCKLMKLHYHCYG